MQPTTVIVLLINSISIFASPVKFPPNFKFGVSSAAFQIEGAWNEDGKGPSLWDYWCHTYPEKCDYTNGDVSADEYHHIEEDVKIMKDLGVDFYRFSLSWPRILPNGTSNFINQKGVDYYMKVLKLLKKHNIEPLVTIYHWDIPLPFAQMGGWLNPLMPTYFEDYARVVFKLFGDYVQEWMTINEIWTSCTKGMETGKLAPGFKLYGTGVYMCAYTQVMAHARAYRLYERDFKPKQQGKVGAVFATNWLQPASNKSVDLAAAERGMEFEIGLYANPLYDGDYPRIVKSIVDFRSKQAGFERSRLVHFTEEEKNMLKGSIDFFGVNYYSAYQTSHHYNITAWPKNTSYDLDIAIKKDTTTSPYKQSNASPAFYNTPWALGKILNWICQHYNHPQIYITENGFATQRELNDTDRINYLEGHLSVVLDAVTRYDAKISKYAVWSFIDDFEWGTYDSRFGLVDVDFEDPNRKRTPKSSYYWYQNLIKKGCIDC